MLSKQNCSVAGKLPLKGPILRFCCGMAVPAGKKGVSCFTPKSAQSGSKIALLPEPVTPLPDHCTLLAKPAGLVVIERAWLAALQGNKPVGPLELSIHCACSCSAKRQQQQTVKKNLVS